VDLGLDEGIEQCQDVLDRLSTTKTRLAATGREEPMFPITRPCRRSSSMLRLPARSAMLRFRCLVGD